MARILITGSSGFIGKHLEQILTQNQYQVTVFKRKISDPKNSELPTLNENQLNDDGYVFDAIVHLAGLAHISPKNADKLGVDFKSANTELTRKLVIFAKNNKVPTFIHLSSIAVVSGAHSKKIINDDTIPNPTTPYAHSKHEAELIVRQLKSEDCLAVSLRPPMVIGRDAKGNWRRLIMLAKSFLPLPFGSVQNQRSVISVDDLCKRILRLLEKQNSVELSGDYCVANTQPLSLSQMINLLRDALGNRRRNLRIPETVFKLASHLPIVGRSVQSLTGNLVIDGSRFDRVFEFQQECDVKDAVKKSVISREP